MQNAARKFAVLRRLDDRINRWWRRDDRFGNNVERNRFNSFAIDRGHQMQCVARSEGRGVTCFGVRVQQLFYGNLIGLGTLTDAIAVGLNGYAGGLQRFRWRLVAIGQFRR